MTEFGNPTRHYQWLLPRLDHLRGLYGRVRLTPHIADSLLSSPSSQFIATYKDARQKMVDQMIAEDAHFVASTGLHRSIMLMTDDDDFVPTVFAINSRHHIRVVWLRQRDSAENDKLFDRELATFVRDGGW